METIEECLLRMAECFKTLRSDRKQFFPASVQIPLATNVRFWKKRTAKKARMFNICKQNNLC